VPGTPFTVPVPVLHHDRPPEGYEATIWSSTPASEWDEHWVALDVPAARAIWNQIHDGIRALTSSPAIELLP
jgi:hypothetical protein